jgi:hypothetical protein
MTKKRWIVLTGMLAACVCLTLAVLALLPPRPGVTPANIQCIEKGMTLAEVEKILGGPGKVTPADPEHITEIVWHHPDEETSVIVWFDADNRVTGRPSSQLAPFRQETFWQKLRRLLRL